MGVTWKELRERWKDAGAGHKTCAEHKTSSRSKELENHLPFASAFRASLPPLSSRSGFLDLLSNLLETFFFRLL